MKQLLMLVGLGLVLSACASLLDRQISSNRFDKSEYKTSRAEVRGRL